MRIDQDSVPSTIEAAVMHIVESLSAADREFIENSLGGFEVHHSIGRYIRNNWSLWDSDSPLKRDAVKTYRIAHADDISGLIIDWVYARARGLEFDPCEACKRFHEHWAYYGTDSLSAGGWRED